MEHFNTWWEKFSKTYFTNSTEQVIAVARNVAWHAYQVGYDKALDDAAEDAAGASL